MIGDSNMKLGGRENDVSNMMLSFIPLNNVILVSLERKAMDLNLV